MKILLLSCLMIASTVQLFAQETVTDSIKSKTKIAIADAKHFKLDKQTQKVYRKYGVSNTSDYFKPNTINSTHSEWLTDSVYVKAYRTAALKKTQQQYGIAQFRLFGGIYSGVVFAVVAFALLAIASTGKLK